MSIRGTPPRLNFAVPKVSALEPLPKTTTSTCVAAVSYQSGQVLLDDRDLGVYNNKFLRRQVALVSQEPVLYARSIR